MAQSQLTSRSARVQRLPQPVEFAKYRALDLDPGVFNRVMGTTAVEVFNLRWSSE
jgi:hypothetical protein